MWYPDCAYTHLAAGLLLTPLVRNVGLPSLERVCGRQETPFPSHHTALCSFMWSLVCSMREREVWNHSRDEWSLALQMPMNWLPQPTRPRFLNNYNFLVAFYSLTTYWEGYSWGDLLVAYVTHIHRQSSILISVPGRSKFWSGEQITNMYRDSLPTSELLHCTGSDCLAQCGNMGS